MRAHLILDVPLIALALALGWVHGWWPVLILVGLSVLVHASQVLNPRSSFYLRVHHRMPASQPVVALTFDDGPDPVTTPAILDLLRAAGVQATFFVIGRHAAAHPDLLRRIVAEGHALGLHSQDHARCFPLFPPGLAVRDLQQTQEAIAAAGLPVPRLFRPPMGITTPFVAEAARRLGLLAVTWSVRGRDSTTCDPQVIIKRILPGLAPGAIILLHDGSEPRHPADRQASVAALACLLRGMTEAGLRSRALQADGPGRGLAWG